MFQLMLKIFDYSTSHLTTTEDLPVDQNLFCCFNSKSVIFLLLLFFFSLSLLQASLSLNRKQSQISRLICGIAPLHCSVQHFQLFIASWTCQEELSDWLFPGLRFINYSPACTSMIPTVAGIQRPVSSWLYACFFLLVL